MKRSRRWRDWRLWLSPVWLGLLVLFLAAWIRSAGRSDTFHYTRSPLFDLSIFTFQGSIRTILDDGHGLQIVRGISVEPGFRSYEIPAGQRTNSLAGVADFRLNRGPGVSAGAPSARPVGFFLSVPFWFLTAIHAVVGIALYQLGRRRSGLDSD